MTQVKIEEVRRGDVIVEGGRRITVAVVERMPPRCSFHVHVNEALCWDAGSLVTVDRRD